MAGTVPRSIIGVDCGSGRDTVLTDNTTEDTILANCEVVRRG